MRAKDVELNDSCIRLSGSIGLDDLDQFSSLEAAFVLGVDVTSAARTTHLLAEEVGQPLAILWAHN